MDEPSTSAVTEPVYTVREIAKALRVSEHKVKRLINAGELDAFKVGREWRVKESNRDAFFTKIGFLSACDATAPTASA